MTSSRRGHSGLRAAALAVALLIGGACNTPTPQEQELVPGVVFRRDTTQGTQTLTIERAIAQVRPVVVAENLEKIRNNTVGDAHTVQEWARKYDAIAGVNGGFFGETYDSLGRRKQLVQLCVVEGKVVAPGAPVGSALRSGIGFTGSGEPEISWVVGNEKSGALRYERPVKSKQAVTWRMESAVAAGPRLIHRGKIDIADRAEKLVSDVRVTRMAVAFNERYLVFCRADAMTYGELARSLVEFYKKQLQSAPDEALCLDGGPSAQLVYRGPGSGPLQDVEPTGVQVPSAILLLPRR